MGSLKTLDLKWCRPLPALFQKPGGSLFQFYLLPCPAVSSVCLQVFEFLPPLYFYYHD